MNGRQAGFTYLGILFAVAFLGTSLASTGIVWSVVARRSAERELLFVGHEFRDAIESYYQDGPSGAHQYPRSLEELLADRRRVDVVRHLRRIYADPVTGQVDWELVTLPDGGIVGVASRAAGRPLKRAQFDPEDEGFEGADCYCDWRFVYLPQLVAGQNAPLRP